MQSSDGTKCPMCGALIATTARMCGSCGETLISGGTGEPGRVRVRFAAQLPDVCALCGEAATRRNRILFRHGRENLGRPIMLPVCHRHRFFQPPAWLPMIRMILISPFIILGAVGLVRRSFGFPMALISGAGLVAALVCAVAWDVWQSRGPRSPFEDSTHIMLDGVAPKFALACEEIDDREAEQVGDDLAQMFAEHSREQSPSDLPRGSA